jgi:hypothetical protein
MSISESTLEQKRKLPRTAFKPGVSGNPGGRPREVAHVRELARKYTDEAILALVDVLRNKKERGSARVAAAEALLSRGYGRPAQAIELSGADGPLTILGIASRAELETLIQNVPKCEREPQNAQN